MTEEDRERLAPDKIEPRRRSAHAASAGAVPYGDTPASPVEEDAMTRTAKKDPRANRKTAAELTGAWAILRDRLAEALGVLEAGQYLILSGARGPYFVQFAMEEGSLLWAEAVSNAFLPKGQRLRKAQVDTLVTLGWRAPVDESRSKKSEEDSGGSPNFQGRFEGAEQFATAATMAVVSFRDVYGFRKPASLRYNAFDDYEKDILLPTLGLGRHRERAEETVDEVPASLEEQVLEAVRDGLGAEDARFDRKSLLGLEADGEAVFALVLDDPPCVRLFAPVLLDVTNEEEALGLLNTLNFEGRHARFVLDEGTVLAVIDLPGEPFVPEHFVDSFMALASAASELPEGLAKVIGRRAPSEPKPVRGGGKTGKRPRRR